MEEGLAKNITIHISSKSHLNLTFNLHQCGNYQLVSGSMFPIHASGAFTCLYVNRGRAMLESGGLAYELVQGQGMYAFPDADYDICNLQRDTLDITWLSFSGYSVEHYLKRSNIFRTRPVFCDPEGIVGKKINRLYTASQKFPNRYCPMMALQYEIFSYLLDTNSDREAEIYEDPADYYAVKAVEYIENNYTRNITVDEMAEALGIPRKRLYAIFGRVLKISPKQYLISYRIEKACQRLKATSQPIQEIAESVGYLNQFYFAKEFKRLTGMTPTEYRSNPGLSEIFSYRTFVPTLQAQSAGPALPPLEEIVPPTVWTPLKASSREPQEKQRTSEG